MRKRMLAVIWMATGTTGLAQTTWHVDVNNTPPGSGTQDDPYSSIQYAIEQVSTLPGDSLLVLPGLYVENINFLGKSLTLASEEGAATTLLDGGALAPVLRLENGEGPGTAIVGFTIRNGAGSPDAQGNLTGGGLRILGGTIELSSCVIEECYAAFGGGFFAENTTLSIKDCTFGPNICGGGGEARSSTLFLEDTVIFGQEDRDCGFWPYSTTALRARDSLVSIAGCSFEKNKSGLEISGVDLIRCDATISQTRFVQNGNYPSDWIDQCGALGVLAGKLRIFGCYFFENDGQRTVGAIEIKDADVEIEDCTFDKNVCSEPYWGGTVGASASSGGTLRLAVRRCTFSRGRSAGGSAIWIAGGDATIEDCLFHANLAYTQYYGEEGAGGAIWIHGNASARIEGCTFLSNFSNGSEEAGKGGAIYAKPGASVLVRRSVFAGNASAGDTEYSNHPPQGGACYGAMQIESCTFLGNRCVDDKGTPGEGGAVYGGTLNSCIVRASFPDALSGGSAADWSDIQGGWPGTGNFDADPMFWGPEHGDLHLLPGSPCIVSVARSPHGRRSRALI